MKQVALMRHAKSSWKFPELTDFERPLNKRGMRDAPMMGERLAKRGFSTDFILTSPAQRAVATARNVARSIGFPVDQIREDPNLYLADPDTLLGAARSLSEAVDTVMLFGHNPGFTILANELGDLTLDNLPTCGFALFEFDIKHWRDLDYGTGTARLFDFPKNTAKP